jgi:hypothetical protein
MPVRIKNTGNNKVAAGINHLFRLRQKIILGYHDYLAGLNAHSGFHQTSAGNK